MNEDVEFVPIKERGVKTYVIKVVVSAFADDIDAGVEVSEIRQKCCPDVAGVLPDLPG